MTGTVTIKMTNPQAQDADNVVTIDWISTAGGVVTADLATEFSVAELAKGYSGCPQPNKFIGFIRRIVTAPGLNGDLATSLPTAAYDITLTDPYDNDLAASNLQNRSGTVAEAYLPAAPIYVHDELTLNISSAGGTTKGRVVIYIAKETW